MRMRWNESGRESSRQVLARVKARVRAHAHTKKPCSTFRRQGLARGPRGSPTGVGRAAARDRSASSAARTLSLSPPLFFYPLPFPSLLPAPLSFSSHLFFALPTPQTVLCPSLTFSPLAPSIPASSLFLSSGPSNLTSLLSNLSLWLAFCVRCPSVPLQTRYLQTILSL